MKGTLTPEEIACGRLCLDTVIREGASDARITLNKSQMDLVATLDGKIDRISHCLDRSLSLALFVEGRYGTFSTNRLDPQSLTGFARKAVETARVLAPDSCRHLPPRERIEKGAVTGQELELCDSLYEDITPESRIKAALDASLCHPRGEEDSSLYLETPDPFDRSQTAPSPAPGKENPLPSASPSPGKEILLPEGVQLLSEEGEYSDSVFDTIVIDSRGACCRHTETSFEYGVEVTVSDSDGNKYSSYWWDAAPFLKDLDHLSCPAKALERACAQIGPRALESARCNIVIDSEVASKLVTPILNALAGSAIQQHNSFLDGTLGQKVFSEGLTITDDCRTPGLTGGRLFDSEGVSTKTHTVIRNGVVEEYFLNTYMSEKTGMPPTSEDITRARVEGWPRRGLRREDLMQMCGDGVLITGFNGGNFNAATGEFSYGIEGFAFKDGAISHPIREMLLTGDMKTLWNNLIAVGEDARPCTSRSIPSLAFSKADLSA